MISLISSLSLKLHLNSLVYHREIFGSSSKVFGNLRKISGNVRERSSGLQNNFGKSSEIFGRWSEIFGKSSKPPSSECLYNKKNITGRLEDMNLISSWQKQYFTPSLPVSTLWFYRHECFTGKYNTGKIHKNYIRDPSGLFSIISHVRLSMISLISSLSLKLHLNSLVYHREIFGSSSKVFGNLRKISGNVRERSSGLQNNFGKSSEIFGRWSEIFGKSSKPPSSECLYNKKNITGRLEDMNLISSWQKQYFTPSLRSFVKYCFATRK